MQRKSVASNPSEFRLRCPSYKLKRWNCCLTRSSFRFFSFPQFVSLLIYGLRFFTSVFYTTHGFLFLSVALAFFSPILYPSLWRQTQMWRLHDCSMNNREICFNILVYANSPTFIERKWRQTPHEWRKKIHPDKARRRHSEEKVAGENMFSIINPCVFAPALIHSHTFTSSYFRWCRHHFVLTTSLLQLAVLCVTYTSFMPQSLLRWHVCVCVCVLVQYEKKKKSFVNARYSCVW